jgi:1,4-alpha-glucan branching enzyme
MSASVHSGMGANPFEGGVAFRVWAPFADKVCVAGTFNDWKDSATALTSEGNGFWSTDFGAARIGHQYKFVLRGKLIKDKLWKNDPYARSLTNSAGNSIIAEADFDWTAASYRTPAWNEMVIYELHVGSFLFDRTNRGGRGDFDTVITKLGYLIDLGVNVIQLLPSDEFPGDISMGYNPSYIFAIEENYGGPNGLRRLVDAAHSKGIAIIFDVVYNHLGPNDLDLWQFDGWNEHGNGGIYFYNDWRRITPWGETRPDYGRGEVRQYIRDNALRFLEQRACDGLRFDATGWIRNVWGNDNDPGADIPAGWNLLQWINSEIRDRQPWKITIAEDMHDNEWITRSVGEGGAGFDAQWGASFVHRLRETLAAPDDAGRDMGTLAAVIGQRYNNNAFQRVVYTESHDEVAETHGNKRVPEIIWPGNADSYPSQKRSTLGAALVFTAPGIPMIFMGQEFLEWGAWSDGRELDWSKATRFAGIRALYRDLIHLRRNWFNNSAGLKGQFVNVHHVNPRDKLLAFHRWDHGGPGDDVIVLANFGAQSYDRYTIGLPRPGFWRVRFNSDWNGYSPIFRNHPSFDVAADGAGQDSMPCSGALGIGAYSAVILSQDR